MGTKDYRTFPQSIGEHWNRIHNNKWGCSGSVITPFGIVDVTSYNSYPSTMLLLVYDGVIHARVWEETFLARTLVTLAKRFAKEIAG